MPRLTVDKQEIEVPKGATILDAAAKVGIVIPTMCFLEQLEPSISCMLCVVKVQHQDALVPSCGTLAEEGMRVQTDTEEIRQARKTALELLLSDHVGDCMGPCQLACPAKMNIPLMLRQIVSGELDQAIATVKRDIALPAVLGRICSA
ncbi:MAG TPA: 2Fe-2S iron-sulfur cluster binding domain-containing protein, partial [bacterium]|nr:2Fe-2S iron-sulfur cluster binding domain-containing protein [bacterium]